MQSQHYKYRGKWAPPHCFVGHMPLQPITAACAGTHLQPFTSNPGEEGHCLGNLRSNQVTWIGSHEWPLLHNLLLQNQVKLLNHLTAQQHNFEYVEGWRREKSRLWSLQRSAQYLLGRVPRHKTLEGREA